MMPEKMCQQLLALGAGWRVEAMDYLEREQQHSSGWPPLRRRGRRKRVRTAPAPVCAATTTPRHAVSGGLLEPFRQVATMVTNHLEGILAHWRQGLTTAFLEGLNSLFSAVKRKARGYRSTEHQTARLYFVAGKLPIAFYD